MKLIDLGLEDCVENIDAQKVFGYALFKEGKSTRLLTHWRNLRVVLGRCFHNGRFGQRMREKAATVPKLEQGTMTSLLEEKGAFKGVRYKTKGGLDIIANATLTIACYGCFSNLRRGLCKPEVTIGQVQFSDVNESTGKVRLSHELDNKDKLWLGLHHMILELALKQISGYRVFDLKERVPSFT
ncbi:squalene epoxidase, FAD/NAD(P)-binding domain protein [Artemisia annua]|uniref:Squalene monooxygenase n=1 Tax=Artemisia annua TaxID=35608 RepID=A0A2U1P6U0_ARTAN|nr:squalene epoxidase, FAD/NAD(P)-binding domain protein [Artemisia annua]